MSGLLFEGVGMVKRMMVALSLWNYGFSATVETLSQYLLHTLRMLQSLQSPRE